MRQRNAGAAAPGQGKASVSPAPPPQAGQRKSLAALVELVVMLVAASGVVLTTQNVSRLGVASRALATPLAQYSADSLLGISAAAGGNGTPTKRSRGVRFFTVLLIPSLDLLGCVLGFAGVERLGGSSFTTLFSVNLVNTAVLSRVILGRRLSAGQLFSIAVVSVGLVLRSSGGSGHSLDQTGVACTLASSVVYALRSVVMEAVRASGKDAPSGAELAARIGNLGFVAMALWQVFYTYPNRHSLLLLPLRRSGASLLRVAGAFGLFMASRAFLVAMQTRVITGPFGATGAAMVFSCRGATVSLLSSLLFCSVDPKECLSTHGLLCSLLIMVGGIGYSFSPPGTAKTVGKAADAEKRKKAS